MPGSAPLLPPCDDDHANGPDRERAATRRSIIDLALVQDQLRSLPGQQTRARVAPDVTALTDQLRAHEREILRTLRRRRLPFRALVIDADTTCVTVAQASLEW